MKKIICLVVVMVLFSVVFAGCKSNSNSDSAYKKAKEATTASQTEEPTTAKATEKPTEKATEAPTEKPTEAPTEAPKPKEYTAEDLLKKSVSEILDLLNNNITVEVNGSHSHFGSSTGMPCFFNFDKLPGFVFCPKNVRFDPSNIDLDDLKDSILSGDYSELLFIAVCDGAKLNNEIDSGMNYNDISGITGNYATLPPAGQGLITQNLTDFCDSAANVSVTYETSNEAMKHMSNDGYDLDYLKQENPKAMYIIAYR